MPKQTTSSRKDGKSKPQKISPNPNPSGSVVVESNAQDPSRRKSITLNTDVLEEYRIKPEETVEESDPSWKQCEEITKGIISNALQLCSERFIEKNASNMIATELRNTWLRLVEMEWQDDDDVVANAMDHELLEPDQPPLPLAFDTWSRGALEFAPDSKRESVMDPFIRDIINPAFMSGFGVGGGDSLGTLGTWASTLQKLDAKQAGEKIKRAKKKAGRKSKSPKKSRGKKSKSPRKSRGKKSKSPKKSRGKKSKSPKKSRGKKSKSPKKKSKSKSPKKKSKSKSPRKKSKSTSPRKKSKSPVKKSRGKGKSKSPLKKLSKKSKSPSKKTKSKSPKKNKKGKKSSTLKKLILGEGDELGPEDEEIDFDADYEDEEEELEENEEYEGEICGEDIVDEYEHLMDSSDEEFEVDLKFPFSCAMPPRVSKPQKDLVTLFGPKSSDDFDDEGILSPTLSEEYEEQGLEPWKPEDCGGPDKLGVYRNIDETSSEAFKRLGLTPAEYVRNLIASQEEKYGYLMNDAFGKGNEAQGLNNEIDLALTEKMRRKSHKKKHPCIQLNKTDSPADQNLSSPIPLKIEEEDGDLGEQEFDIDYSEPDPLLENLILDPKTSKDADGDGDGKPELMKDKKRTKKNIKPKEIRKKK